MKYDWARSSLLKILSSGTQDERVSRLQRMGAIDENCNLTNLYSSRPQGHVSYTSLFDPVEEEDDEAS